MNHRDALDISRAYNQIVLLQILNHGRNVFVIVREVGIHLDDIIISTLQRIDKPHPVRSAQTLLLLTFHQVESGIPLN